MILLFFIFCFFSCHLGAEQRDIYDVIVDAQTHSETHSPISQTPMSSKQLKPVYYVGIYDEKPINIPNNYDVEIMTSKIGKRFVCLIPNNEGNNDDEDKNTKNIQEKKNYNEVDEKSKIKRISNVNNDNNNNNNINNINNNNNINNVNNINNNNNDNNNNNVDAHKAFLQLYDNIENRYAYLNEIIQKSSQLKEKLPSPLTRDKKKQQKEENNNNGKTMCLSTSQGYWTYEACLLSNIVQYHGHEKSPLFQLGTFVDVIDSTKLSSIDVEHFRKFNIKNVKNSEKENEINEINNVDSNNNHDKNYAYKYAYLLEYYPRAIFEKQYNFLQLLFDSGDHKRRAIVTLTCPKLIDKKEDGIYEITEPFVHNYHIVIALQSICNFEKSIRKYANSQKSMFPSISNDVPSPSSQQSQFHFRINNNVDADGNNVDQSIVFTNGDQQQHFQFPSQQSQTESNVNSNDVSVLLSPLYKKTNQQCLFLYQGWWTIEFCYGKHIRQVHFESKTDSRSKEKKTPIEQTMTAEHVMGRWDENQKLDETAFRIVKNEANPERTYCEQIYENGDICDLSKKPRLTRVQYRCRDKDTTTMVVSIREDPSCEYIVEVETPLLCNHKDFIIPRSPAYEIVCYPFNEEEFRKPSEMKSVIENRIQHDELLHIIYDVAIANHDDNTNNNNNHNDNNNKNEIKSEL